MTEAVGRVLLRDARRGFSPADVCVRLLETGVFWDIRGPDS